MKNYIRNNLKLSVVVMAVIMLSSTISVAAYANLDFRDKATSWQKENCTQKELDKKTVKEVAAICHSLDQSFKNTADIARIKSTPTVSSSFYRLLDQNISLYPYNANTGNSTTIAPNASVITKLTVVNTNSNLTAIEHGHLDVTLVVNGIETGLKARLDNVNLDTIKTDSVHVKEGDIISLKLTPSDSISLTNDPYNMHSLAYNIGLYAQTK